MNKKRVGKSEIALCVVNFLNVRCFFIKIDCLCTYTNTYTNVPIQINRKNKKFKTLIPGGGEVVSFTTTY